MTFIHIGGQSDTSQASHNTRAVLKGKLRLWDTSEQKSK